jgi:Rap1a immunity proteins
MAKLSKTKLLSLDAVDARSRGERSMGARHIKLVLAASMMLVPISEGSSQDGRVSTGNWWFALCVKNEPMCTGYIAAVVDIYEFTHAPSYCPPRGPNGANIGQVQDIVVKYVRDNPEKRHLPFMRLTLDALEKAFPCQSKSN